MCTCHKKGKIMVSFYLHLLCYFMYVRVCVSYCVYVRFSRQYLCVCVCGWEEEGVENIGG